MSALAASAALFASTNVDDLILLIALFAQPLPSTRAIVGGQFLGIGALYGASVVGAISAYALPLPVIGLLGVVPIALGLRGLWLLRVRGDGEHAVLAPTGWLQVAAITVANGGDNIATYTPWFAAVPAREIFIAGVVFAALTALWCALARTLVAHPSAGAPLRRHGPWLAPVALVLVGAAVLVKTGAPSLLG